MFTSEEAGPSRSKVVVDIAPLPTLPCIEGYDAKSHHLTNGKGFRNPWKSFNKSTSLFSVAHAAATGPKPVPVPINPADRPVQVVRPSFNHNADSNSHSSLKLTWLGHASWLLRFPSLTSEKAGISILLDPFFSERASPVAFAGPKRYNDPPCLIEELPLVDVVCISHSHYDHCDHHALSSIWERHRRQGQHLVFFAPLKLKEWLIRHIRDLPSQNVYELDWWEGRKLKLDGAELDLHCTPAQHESRRSTDDGNRRLWCSWTMQHRTNNQETLTCFFAGDTGYRSVPASAAQPLHPSSPYPGEEKLAKLECCPVFKHIGNLLGSVDVALLPIGCFNPVPFLSQVHASPWDAVDMHNELGARSSIGMHFGTLRGGISAAYEEIHLPASELRAACERKGIHYAKISQDESLAGSGEFVICNIGTTVNVRGSTSPVSK